MMPQGLSSSSAFDYFLSIPESKFRSFIICIVPEFGGYVNLLLQIYSIVQILNRLEVRCQVVLWPLKRLNTCLALLHTAEDKLAETHLPLLSDISSHTSISVEVKRTFISLTRSRWGRGSL